MIGFGQGAGSKKRIRCDALNSLSPVNSHQSEEMRIGNFCRTIARRWLPLTILLGIPTALHAEPVVPGSGQHIVQVGDDFEDPNWEYIANLPKNSHNLDEQRRFPGGESKNGRWYEGVKRGQPDIVRRVETPAGGLPGSQGALLLRSLYTGIPGSPSYRVQQDDFIADVRYRLGGAIPVSQTPSVVVRVLLPPVDQWEKRTGPHFALRASVDTTIANTSSGRHSSGWKRETYWPGMFIEFESKADGRRPNDYAYLRIRANGYGGDFKGKQIAQTGWWTLGMSFTPDGQVHYYASPGVDDLTAEDYITSQYPYGYHCERFETLFFNVCSGDDGHTWSTAWIVDDASVYFIRPER
jgi:hypothetical protein